MIRGVKQPFKFTTPTDFQDINSIKVIFSQFNNNGNQPTAPMPIVKEYNNEFEAIDEWNANLDTTQTYQVGTKYYWYDSNEQKTSDTPPTESDIFGGTINVYPLGNDCHMSKYYKCEQSYYQFNPKTNKWDITLQAPSVEPQTLSRAGKDNIPDTMDKKRACVYNQSYYRYDGKSWQKSTTEILPIEEISYWDLTKVSTYNQNKTYCALETYYKYNGSGWITYGRPQKVSALNDECDKSKICMMEEFYYRYNVNTDQFEKAGVRETYYKYDNGEWIECDSPCAGAVEIDLWIDSDDHDTDKVYVCKTVYYRYNAGLTNPMWEASNNMLVPVVEIDEWIDDDYHDTSKIYMCPAKYYMYNIAKAEWEETDSIVTPRTVKLNYWTEQFDKEAIYFCGPTYFRYDSASSKWLSSASFNMKFTQIDYSSEAIDKSKIYECSPTYYVYIDGTWEQYKDAIDVAQTNDGFAQVSGEPKSFVVELTAEETMRFMDKYKGRVQAIVDDISHPMEYFSIYPTLIDEIN